ncbi:MULTISPECIES: hypothetical protein [Bacteria]|jgi:hypothetical protein|uniref:Uncharacterized protein n=3 Tax=Bacillus cereus group TaxID=86661 RepID=A0A643LPZ6_BACTU|nr:MULTISPECIES: hypothetical protein [Bacteria]EEM38448.1 hypothetical protein bthur0004_56540 [Bacillus thuringiensis serovar sotto str. T04001]MBD0788911.1 hypothetical protein [Vibrio sp. Y2-5]MBF1827799.1 hypothetical protein [Escherichia coli]MCQ3246193.1 hypothetical protein [Salmonella enterica subsp. enterica serovar Indiana]MCZ2990439.1 hypothetical protein [Acinetobacter baumannii]MDV8116432.1 hypothetical protein [Bacillus sp. BAU-SS-2023]
MLSEQVIYYWNDELQYYYLAEKKNGSYKFVQPLKKLELDDISDPLEREQMKKMLEIKKRMSETKGNWF